MAPLLVEGKQRQPQRNHVSIIENKVAIRNRQACLRSFSPNHKGVLALRCSQKLQINILYSSGSL